MKYIEENSNFHVHVGVSVPSGSSRLNSLLSEVKYNVLLDVAHRTTATSPVLRSDWPKAPRQTADIWIVSATRSGTAGASTLCRESLTAHIVGTEQLLIFQCYYNNTTSFGSLCSARLNEQLKPRPVAKPRLN